MPLAGPGLGPGHESSAIVGNHEVDRPTARLKLRRDDDLAAIGMHERIVHRLLGHQQEVARHEVGQVKRLADHPHVDMLRAAVACLAGDCLELGLDMTMHGIDGVETLQRLREGFTNAEIARLLGITTHTVKVHVAALITKLGVSDRTQAVARGFDLGLLTVKTQQA